MDLRALSRRVLHAAADPSFVIGAIMVSLLVLLAVFGPEIAPHNPYLRQRLQMIDGELLRAPIEPNDLYPLGTDEWGRDLLSLLLHGARTTLTVAALAAGFRLLLGLLVGAIAGWFPQGPFDRLVSALIDILAAIPGLILGMILVLAVGIRKGVLPFVVAVTVVGWGQVAQIFRSNVYALRKQSFVEAAQAIGLTQLEVLSRHILPNLVSTALALASLQMASALLLLGELGFVSFFIGSGTIIAGGPGTSSQLIFETPAWGAMLGSTWRYFRAIPWLPAVPAIAFLISIVSFNLFGYGLQRFMERGRFYPSGWSVVRVALVVGALLFAAQYILGRSGPEAAYRSSVRGFDPSRVWNEIEFLTRPELEGRYPGSEGRDLAASYIAREFEHAELTPFPHGSYFQGYSTQHGRITRTPELEILDEKGEVVSALSKGLAFDPLVPFDASGTFEGELILHGHPNPQASLFPQPGLFLLVHTPERRSEERQFDWSAEYVPIRVVPDEEIPSALASPGFHGPLAFLATDPYLLLGEGTAEPLLESLGYEFEALMEEIEVAPVDIETGVTLRLKVGLDYEQISGINVVGYVPGSDIRVQTQRVLVLAPYTGPAPVNDRVFPGADENASGLATMLEILRLWREQEFVPDRTVVFAAVDVNGAQALMLDPILATGGSDTWTVVIPYGLGAGEEHLARLAAGGALQGLFDQSARQIHVPTRQLDEWRFFFAGGGGRNWNLPANSAYSGIVVTRPGDERSGTPLDTLHNLEPRNLSEAGQSIALFLMVLSSQ